MSLRATNLNLLPVLQALLREGSVTGAAKSLGLSQPATSAALARLRLELDDPLLIQVGKTVSRSQRAQAMLPELDRLCAGVEALLRKPRFDPYKAKRTFIVAAADYLAYPVGRFLLHRLRQEAPDVRVRFVDMPANLPERLLTRDVDVAVAVRFGDRWPELRMVTGYWNQMVAVVRQGHPLTQIAHPSTKDFSAYPRLAFGGALDARVTGLPDTLNIEPSLVFEQWLTLPLMVLTSDAVAIVPKSLVDDFTAQIPLQILPHPNGPTWRNTGILWSEVQDSDPANQWLRELLKDALQELLGDPDPSRDLPANTLVGVASR